MITSSRRTLNQRWVLLFALLCVGLLQPVAASVPEGTRSVALVMDMDDAGHLAEETDYAGYGALQMLMQMGVPFTVEPTSSLSSLERLNRYAAVIFPGHQVPASSQTNVIRFVAQGGIFIAGGSDGSMSEAGVDIVGHGSTRVPSVAGRFTHESDHMILQGIHSKGLPVLIPPGTDTYPVITAGKDALGLGSVVIDEYTGNAVVVRPHGKGWFITFGVNPFASTGYGMGMATDPDEPRYAFLTAPKEYYKAFNWQTARSIKQAFITENTPNLIWGDEYGNLVLHTLLWAYQQRSYPLVWQWYWPYLTDYAVSIQHDWDGGKTADAVEFREWEEARGIRSAIYVLMPDKPSPIETLKWWEGGWEIALHADKDAAIGVFAAKMAQDLDRIVSMGIPREDIKGVAHHYLRFYQDTPLWWARLGFEYDSTWYDMDWKQIFFTGTSRPFYIKHGTQILPVLELPSRNEDGVMMANNNAYYLGTNDLATAKNRLMAYVDAVATVNGHASWNGHPSHRHDAMHGIEMADLYVTYTKDRTGDDVPNAWFSRPIDVARWFRARTEVQTTQTWDGHTLAVHVSPADVTVPLPIQGYSLLFSETVGQGKVTAVSVDGKPVKVQTVEQQGQRFVAVVFDITGEHEINVQYNRS